MVADSNRILIVGAGLTGSLTALALMKWRPDVEFVLIEQAPHFGGGLILPFFLNSVPLKNRGLIEPLIVREWSGYYVAGPGFSTSLPGQTAYLVPDQLHAEITEKIPAHRLLPGVRVAGIEGNRAMLADGRELRGALILDARGRSQMARSATNWRHVSSRHLRFTSHHDLGRPILIDASFPETGWSFFQYFPLDPFSLLIQSVAYSRSRIAPSPSSPSKGEDGKLLAESDTSEPVPDETLHGQIVDVGDGVPVCAFSAAPWNPAMSSVVASAIQIAMAIAETQTLSRDKVLGSLEALTAQAEDTRRTGLHSPLSLTDTDAGTRLASLCHLWVP